MERAEVWRELYSLLRALCLRSGVESPYGKGDFWIVDDDWGGQLHKICVFRISFITKRLVGDIQALLQTQFADWGVMFQLEILNAVETIPPEGLVVYADAIEEAWDRDLLIRVFQKEFAFGLQ